MTAMPSRFAPAAPRPGQVGALPLRQRHPGYAVIAVAIVLACAAVSGWLY